MKKLKTRQVHLDFHTSEFIDSIGSKFDKKNFQEALRTGNVNSITVFAKCHHGWCYFPSKVGEIHPNLNFDLLGEMIDAAHEIGVNAPVYITVGWSEKDANENPEWIARKKDNSMWASNYSFDAKDSDPKPIASWKDLCPVGGYKDHIYILTEEVCNRYENLDGLFYDICLKSEPCFCSYCKDGMIKMGLDPNSEADAKKYYTIMRKDFMSGCENILKRKHPGATLFFNGAADQYATDYHGYQTHYEIEDLPTTWGGYDKMPLRTKFFARTGKDYLGMTGKFHTMWGEFGGFKIPDALKYECASMLAFGAGCSVGDQLHPVGEMDMGTYKNIGYAYKYVREIEEYCFDTTETTKLGIMLSGNHKSDEGLVKMLLEKQLDFDIVLPREDFSRFQTIILPDCVRVGKETGAKLNSFIEEGKSLLLTGTSGLFEQRDEFSIDVGGKYLQKSKYENDYVVLGDELSDGIVNSPFLFYDSGNIIDVNEGKVLAKIKEPYFNRTYGKYCSHQNTPNKTEDASYPAAIKNGNVVYLAHNVCELYYTYGAQYHRDYLVNALKLVYKNPVMQVNLPSAGRARLANQKENKRYIMHLLYASPIQRGNALVIEDLVELRDVEVCLNIEQSVGSVVLLPSKNEIEFVQEKGNVKFTVPSLKCHCMVGIYYS